MQVYPVTSNYRVFNIGIENELFFQSLGGGLQLFYFISQLKANDAGIYNVNLLDYHRSSGQQLINQYDFDNYAKILNQDGHERVVLLAEGHKLLYPDLLWYNKGGVLNLEAEHDKWCYEQWILEGVPEELIRIKFNVINDKNYNIEDLLRNADFKIRESVKITPNRPDHFPKPFSSHIMVNEEYIPWKLVGKLFEDIFNMYPLKRGAKHDNYMAFLKWSYPYMADYKTIINWLSRKRPDGYKVLPFKLFLETREYLN